MTRNTESGDTARAHPTTRDRKRLVGQATFVSAVFALGLFGGYNLVPKVRSPVVYEAGSLVASAELESALYDPLVREGEGPRAESPFTTPGGQTCRRFRDDLVEGLACQRGGDWRVVELRQPYPL